MPMENVMDSANIKSRIPLNFAKRSVLNPISRQMANTISKEVASIASIGIIEVGNQGFSTSVYFRKLSQFPQAETFLDHIPNGPQQQI